MIIVSSVDVVVVAILLHWSSFSSRSTNKFNIFAGFPPYPLPELEIFFPKWNSIFSFVFCFLFFLCSITTFWFRFFFDSIIVISIQIESNQRICAQRVITSFSLIIYFSNEKVNMDNSFFFSLFVQKFKIVSTNSTGQWFSIIILITGTWKHSRLAFGFGFGFEYFFFFFVKYEICWSFYHFNWFSQRFDITFSMQWVPTIE